MSLPILSISISRAFNSTFMFDLEHISASLLEIDVFGGFVKRRSQQWLARVLIFGCWRSLAMQIMGTFVFLINFSRTYEPPRSDFMPSTSSIKIMNFLLTLVRSLVLKFSNQLSTTPAIPANKDFLFLRSEAFYSTRSQLRHFAMHLTAVVFPIPGGPEIKHALALTFFAPLNPPRKATFFFYPLRMTLSQSYSQVRSYRILV